MQASCTHYNTLAATSVLCYHWQWLRVTWRAADDPTLSTNNGSVKVLLYSSSLYKTYGRSEDDIRELVSCVARPVARSLTRDGAADHVMGRSAQLLFIDPYSSFSHQVHSQHSAWYVSTNFSKPNAQPFVLCLRLKTHCFVNRKT